MLDDADACVKDSYERTPRVATLGFCLGGGISARVATRLSQLTACVVFYGEPPDAPGVQKIRAPILAIHAEQDEIINSKIPEFVQSVLASGKDLTLKVYPPTRHGFFNDSNRETYNGAAAEDAWELTKWFLSRKLRQKRVHRLLRDVEPHACACQEQEERVTGSGCGAYESGFI